MSKENDTPHLRHLFSQRLKLLMEERHLQNTDLAKIINRDKSTVGKWLLEKAMPRMGVIQQLSDYFTVPKSYFVEENTNSAEILTKVKLADSYSYPYFDESVSAGQLENCNGIIDAATIDVPDLLMGKYARDPDIVFMHVNGESMNRVIEDGTLIAVRRLSDRYMYNNGDIVIATNGHDYTVKRMYDDPAHRQLILNPDSTDPAFHPIVIPYDSEDSYQLYGKVVIYSVIL